MDNTNPRIMTSLHVRTTARLQGCLNLNLTKTEIAARRARTTGVVLGLKPCSHESVWFVEHTDGTVAYYYFEELECIGDPDSIWYAHAA